MQEIVEIGRATQDELRDDLRELFQGVSVPVSWTSGRLNQAAFLVSA